VKYLLSAMRICENALRLPLVPVESATERVILDAARAARIETGALAGSPRA